MLHDATEGRQAHGYTVTIYKSVWPKVSSYLVSRCSGLSWSACLSFLLNLLHGRVLARAVLLPARNVAIYILTTEKVPTGEINVLLAALCKIASGRNWDIYLEELLLKVSGMRAFEANPRRVMYCCLKLNDMWYGSCARVCRWLPQRLTRLSTEVSCTRKTHPLHKQLHLKSNRSATLFVRLRINTEKSCQFVQAAFTLLQCWYSRTSEGAF